MSLMGKELCPTDQATLRSDYPELKAADECPVCFIPVGRHPRGLLSSFSASSAPSSHPSHSALQMGKHTTLPKWKEDYHHAKPFLDRIEQLLVADSVDRSFWPRLLMKAVPNVTESSWINTNIIDAKLEWKDARATFIRHFEAYSYIDQLTRDYEHCSQQQKESVQFYSDRFSDLVTQLQLPDDSQLVIQHYLAGLSNEMSGDFLSHLGMLRLVKESPEYFPGSLKDAINLTLELERVRLQRLAPHRSASHANNSVSSSSSSASSGRSSTSSSSTPKKTCIYHPLSSAHSTEECRLGASRPTQLLPLLPPPLPPLSRRTLSSVLSLGSVVAGLVVVLI